MHLRNFMLLVSLITALFTASAEEAESEYLFHGPDTVAVEGILHFYDNGGPDGFYNRDHSGVVVFKPAHPGRALRLHFNYFIAGYNDQLLIYNGSECRDDALLIRLFGDKATTYDLVSTADDGALAVWFKTGEYGLMLEGWDIEIEEFEPTPLQVTAAAAEVAGRASVYPGSQQNALLHITVDIAGERGRLDLSEARFALEGSIMAKAELWSSGTASTFAGAAPCGSVENPSGASFSLPGAFTFAQPGTYHFWLTADIAGNLPAGQTLKIKLDNLTVAGAEITPSPSAEASVTTRAGMHGEFILGSSDGADFKSFNQAVRALADNGVDGPVTMLVESGDYNQTVTFLPVAGASEANTVTFRPISGNPADVKIHYGEPDKATSQGIVTFSDGTSHITLSGLTVASDAKSCPGVVYLQGACKHITIDGCTVTAAASASYEQRNILVYTTYLEEDDKNCNYFTLSNCRLDGGYYGLSVTGITNLNHPLMIHDVTVAGNTFANQACKSLQAMGVKDGLTVTGNVFVNDGAVMTATFHAMDLYRCTGTVTVAGNRFDIYADTMTDSGSDTRAGTADAIYVRDITNTYPSIKYIYNNDIRLDGSPGSDHGLYGIYIDDNTSGQYLHIAHNTILISGQSSPYSAPVMFDAPTPGSSLRANLLQNTLHGTALRGTDSSTLPDMAIADNALYTDCSSLALVPAAVPNMTILSSYLGQPVGIFEQANFVSDDIRELTAPGALVSAAAVDFAAADITGSPRPEGARTVGAYEYRVAPEAAAWLDGFPRVDAVGLTSAVFTAAADCPARVRLVVREASSEAPAEADFASAAQILLHSVLAERVDISGLAKNTDYIAYAALEPYAGGTIEVAAVPFATISDATAAPLPAVTVTAPGGTAPAEGETVVLTATVQGGMEPISCRWTDDAGADLGDGFELTVIAESPRTFRATATDARGKQAFDEINIEVRGPRRVATFDDLWLNPESHWTGSLSNRPFFSGSYAFDNYNGTNSGYSYWGNFTYANYTSTAYGALADQYNNAVGTGLDGSANYGVAYLNSYTGATYLSVVNTAGGDSIPGMWVTNSAWVLDAVRNGDGLSDVEGGFDRGDFFKLSVTGLLNSQNVGTVDFYLADFRPERPDDRYALDTWQWLDLSTLGRVDKLWFRLESTKRNAYGITTPTYFCLDNVGDSCPWTDVPEQTVTVGADGDSGTLSLLPLTDWDPTAATITYAIIEAGAEAAVTDPASGLVTVAARPVEYGGAPFTLLAKATQQGRSRYLRIPVRVSCPSGIDDPSAEAFRITVTAGAVYVETALADYSLAVHSPSGALLRRRDRLSGNTRTPLAVPAGPYILTLSHPAIATTRKIVVR